MRLAVRFGTLLGLLIASDVAFGQTKTIEITVDDFRPMRAAIDKIMELSGIPINYEDMPIYYPADLVEAPIHTGGGQKLFGARGGQLLFSIAVDETTGKLNDLQAVKGALSKLISAYNSSGLPGGFDFEEHKGVFFVKPVRYRGENGTTQTIKSLLSTPITFPQEKRDWFTAARLILQQVSKASGSDISDFDVSIYYGGEQPICANNEPADHVIARVLAALACPVRGRVGCDSVIVQSTWDVGYHYRLYYPYRFRGKCLLIVDSVPNSRWFVPPAPKPLPRSPAFTTNPWCDAADALKMQ